MKSSGKKTLLILAFVLALPEAHAQKLLLSQTYVQYINERQLYPAPNTEPLEKITVISGAWEAVLTKERSAQALVVAHEISHFVADPIARGRQPPDYRVFGDKAYKKESLDNYLREIGVDAVALSLLRGARVKIDVDAITEMEIPGSGGFILRSWLNATGDHATGLLEYTYRGYSRADFLDACAYQDTRKTSQKKRRSIKESKKPPIKAENLEEHPLSAKSYSGADNDNEVILGSGHRIATGQFLR